MAGDAPTEIVTTRRHQMFPVLTESEIARISRFGNLRRYGRGARLFAAGEPGPGMFVVLKGVVAISQRDGLGHVVPIVRLGPGEFSGETAQLSGRHGLVDGYAWPRSPRANFARRSRRTFPACSRSCSVKRVGGAIGEGAAAVAQIHRYLAAARSSSRSHDPPRG